MDVADSGDGFRAETGYWCVFLIIVIGTLVWDKIFRSIDFRSVLRNLLWLWDFIMTRVVFWVVLIRVPIAGVPIIILDMAMSGQLA